MSYDEDDDYDPEGWAEDEFDYEQYVVDHHGDRRRVSGVSPLWQVTAIVLLVLFAAAVLGPMLR